jgi:hypothetical protein
MESTKNQPALSGSAVKFFVVYLVFFEVLEVVNSYAYAAYL